MKSKQTNMLPFIGGSLITIIIGSGIFLLQRGNNPPVAEANEIVKIYQSLTPKAQSLYYEQSEELTKAVPDRLVELDLLTIGCFAPSKVTNMSVDEPNLGGQCCGVLKDADAYEIQLKALERFIANNGNIALIPRDPYDLTVEHAQELTEFDESTQLTPEQQVLYDEAVEKSHHEGPCCCKCWKWYAMSGLAKELIVEYNWTSDQIAELWDLSSSCGHDEDTNMNQHYEEKEPAHSMNH